MCANQLGMSSLVLSVSKGRRPLHHHLRPAGPPGDNGAQGQQGPAGEGTNRDLSTVIGGTSATSHGVATLGLTVSDPPTHLETQALMSKLDELIDALRRQRIGSNKRRSQPPRGAGLAGPICSASVRLKSVTRSGFVRRCNSMIASTVVALDFRALICSCVTPNP